MNGVLLRWLWLIRQGQHRRLFVILRALAVIAPLANGLKVLFASAATSVAITS